MCHVQIFINSIVWDKFHREVRLFLKIPCSASVSYFLFIFNNFCQTYYLKIYWTNLCQISRVNTRGDQKVLQLHTFINKMVRISY